MEARRAYPRVNMKVHSMDDRRASTMVYLMEYPTVQSMELRTVRTMES